MTESIPTNNFHHWKKEIAETMRESALKTIGKAIDLAQKQTDVFDQNPKLTNDELAALRALYSERLKTLKNMGKPAR